MVGGGSDFDWPIDDESRLFVSQASSLPKMLMDNRRGDYRHQFGEISNLHAGCDVSGIRLRCEVLDLSVTGIKLRVHDWPAQTAPGLESRIHLTLGEATLAIGAVLVHGPREHDPTVGLRFLPLADAAENEAREKILWSFLLQEQWKKRKLELAQKFR